MHINFFSMQINFFFINSLENLKRDVLILATLWYLEKIPTIHHADTFLHLVNLSLNFLGLWSY